VDDELNNIKKDLFGAVGTLPVVGNLPAPANRLREPLPDEDYGLHFFCSGYGTVLPVLKTAINEIVGEERSSYEDLYIATERCDLCGGDCFENAYLVQITVGSVRSRQKRICMVH
jgi:hypothetical protein